MITSINTRNIELIQAINMHPIITNVSITIVNIEYTIDVNPNTISRLSIGVSFVVEHINTSY